MSAKELSDIDLAVLMNVPLPTHKERIEAKVALCVEVLADKLNVTLQTPTVRYDLKGRTAGWYICAGNYIRLNIAILNDPRYTEDMIEDTVPHEVAHSVQRQLYPDSKSHGREWAMLMHLLGLNATRCHQYDTVPAKKPRARPYRYTCSEYCSKNPHMVTDTIHRRIQTGHTRYRCNTCGAYLT